MFRKGIYDDFSYLIFVCIFMSGLFILFIHIFEVTLICKNEDQSFEKKMKIIDYEKNKNKSFYLDINENLKLNINQCIQKEKEK